MYCDLEPVAWTRYQPNFIRSYLCKTCKKYYCLAQSLTQVFPLGDIHKLTTTVTMLVYGWCHSISSKSKCQTQTFPSCYSNKPQLFFSLGSHNLCHNSIGGSCPGSVKIWQDPSRQLKDGISDGFINSHTLAKLLRFKKRICCLLV